MSFRRERRAFYRILFRHQDRVCVGESEVGGYIPMMVRERMRLELQSERFEMCEKALRISDAGDRVHA